MEERKRKLRQEIENLYPHYNLTDQLYIIHGVDHSHTSLHLIKRVIVKNLIDLSSVDLNSCFTEDHSRVMEIVESRVETYLMYLLAFENEEYEFFNAKDSSSVLSFFIDLRNIMDDIDGYMRKVKDEGYTKYITLAGGKGNKIAAYIFIEQIIFSFEALIKAKKVISTRNGDITDSFAREIMIFAMQNEIISFEDEDPEDNKDNSYGKGKYIPFNKAKEELGIIDNRSLKKYLEDLGLKYIVKKGKNYISESNLKRIKDYFQKRL